MNLNCPSCNTSLELDDQEMKERAFRCPSCSQLHYLDSLPAHAFQTSLTEAETELFTEHHIAFGTALGGPAVGGYLLAENFKVLNDHAASRVTLYGGIVVAILLFPLLLLLPGDVVDAIPRQSFDLLWAVILFLIVRKYQGESIGSHLQRGGKKASGWKVFLIGILGAVITLAYAFAVLFIVTYDDPEYAAYPALAPLNNDNTRGILYYDSLQILPQDAKVVNLALSQIGYFNPQTDNEALYYKENGTFYIEIFVEEQYWNEGDVQRCCRYIIRQLSSSYPGKTFAVKLTSLGPDGEQKSTNVE